ncbi:hypothetical protein SS209_04061 [Salmonella enterica subsp. enterica serovar Senftenberg str. SS209]|nr:hypothetical protein SS209_04061 [Salmonella enterica subsp. enterica serovar Senftenberg str. SS209]
MCWRRK